MTFRILNCASMTPWWPRWEVGATCLLVDTNQGPILVDTGLGIHDHECPTRLVKIFQKLLGITNAPEECAVNQLSHFGVRPGDIQHIILTHLHCDHAGGLPDFPNATVHVHRMEYEALLHPNSWIERFAYDKADFVHNPHWKLYKEITDKWYGFDAIHLPFIPKVYLIPLFGHTSGHCGVAVENGRGWIFLAGDSIPINADFHITPDWLNRLILGSHGPDIEKLSIDQPEIRVLSAHAFKSFYNNAQI